MRNSPLCSGSIPLFVTFRIPENEASLLAASGNSSSAAICFADNYAAAASSTGISTDSSKTMSVPALFANKYKAETPMSHISQTITFFHILPYRFAFLIEDNMMRANITKRRLKQC